MTQETLLRLIAYLQDAWHYAHGALNTGESVFDCWTLELQVDNYRSLRKLMNHTIPFLHEDLDYLSYCLDDNVETVEAMHKESHKALNYIAELEARYEMEARTCKLKGIAS